VLLVLLLGLVTSGDWGKALRVARNAVATAEKNENHNRKYALLLYQALPHLFAGDCTGALELCESALPGVQHPDQVMFLHQALVMAGTALAGLGRYEPAGTFLSQARERIEAQPVQLSWYWKMPLQSALTDLSVQRGDLQQAQLEARRFVEISMATEERTWQALAWEASARVAFAGSDMPQAQDCIRKAIGVMQGFDLPVACWRVHSTAMQLFPQNAEEHQRQAAAGIQRLSESLKEFPQLQETFLSTEPVRRVARSRATVREMQSNIHLMEKFSSVEEKELAFFDKSKAPREKHLRGED
jgi:tetratricopeptide (TPR) repeat protein